MDMATLKQHLFDPSRPSSLSGLARAKRWRVFQEAFPDLELMRVLDLGGTPGYWLSGPVRPGSVRCVNLDPHNTQSDWSWIEYAVGDACELEPGGYDLVVLKSCIVHV